MYNLLSKLGFGMDIVGILAMMVGCIGMLIGFDGMGIVNNGFIILVFGSAIGVVAILWDMIFG